MIERFNLLTAEQREVTQIFASIPVIDVQPELIELVRRRERRVQPYRASFRLAELRPRRRGDERQRRGLRVHALDLANQFHARRDVPPLIAAAHLQHRPIASMQFQEIIRLQQHVAEFSERNTAL